jgi:hypothetical protein
MTRTDRGRWRAARSISDLGHLTALWLEGEVASHPSCAMPNYGPDEETAHLVPVLAAANRAGYLTDNSQPGLIERGRDGDLWEQRAAVTGWIDRNSQQLVRRITTAARDAGLLVCVDHPGSDIPVTKVDGQDYTVFGAVLPEYLPVLWPARLIDRGLFTTLTNATAVTVVDPRYGRDSLLWPVLAEAVGYDFTDRWNETGQLREGDGRNLDNDITTLGRAYAREFTHPSARGSVTVVHYIARGATAPYVVVRGLHHSYTRDGQPRLARICCIGVLNHNSADTLHAAEALAHQFTAQVTPTDIRWDGTAFPDGGRIDLPHATLQLP